MIKVNSPSKIQKKINFSKKCAIAYVFNAPYIKQTKRIYFNQKEFLKQLFSLFLIYENLTLFINLFVKL